MPPNHEPARQPKNMKAGGNTKEHKNNMIRFPKNYNITVVNIGQRITTYFMIFMEFRVFVF